MKRGVSSSMLYNEGHIKPFMADVRRKGADAFDV